MNNITGYKELLVEKQRLKLLLAEKKIELQSEVEEFKVKLKPFSSVLDFFEKVTSKDKQNPLVNAGIDIGVNLLIRRVLLRNTNWVFRLLIPVLVKNFLSHEVTEKPNVLSRTIGFLKKQVKRSKLS